MDLSQRFRFNNLYLGKGIEIYFGHIEIPLNWMADKIGFQAFKLEHGESISGFAIEAF